MKPLFLLLLGLVLHPARAQIYLPDTLRIQRLATSYLLFPDAITLVDISPEYQVKIEAQTLLFVRPRLIQARPTPLLVRTRQQTYLGYLATAPGASPAFVDIATLLPPPATPPPAGTLPPAEAAPPSGLDSLFHPPQGRRRSLGISRHSGIRLQLTQLFHDQDHTYLQLSVRNRSRMPYLPAQLSAEYVQPVRRRRATYLAADRHPLTAVFQDMTARISPDSTGWIRLVFPQFAPRRRSRLVLYLREQEGTRNLTLSLPMRKVLYARFLRDHTRSFPPPALDSLSVHP